MTSPSLLQAIESSALDSLVADECLPLLQDALQRAGAYHRLRVTDLPSPVIHRLCESLQESDRWVVRALNDSNPTYPYESTATKLIELRNTLEQPLLVFLPTGLRTAAEDSLDIATFQQIKLSTVPDKITKKLIQRLPESIQAPTIELIRTLRERQGFQDEDLIVRYLLTVLNNGATPEAAGGALFSLGLIPDFELFSRTDQISKWLSRNIKAVEGLEDLRRPTQERISQLPLEPNSIQPQLFAYLRSHTVGISRDWMADIALQTEWRSLSLDQWTFEDRNNTDEVRLVLDPLALPKQSPDQFGETISLPVLDFDSNTNLKIAFRSIPSPEDVDAWKTYRIQILDATEDASTIRWESNNFQKPAKKSKVNRTIKGADLKNALTEGTYFMRVEAFGADGAILTKSVELDETQFNGRRENESENFLVVFGGAVVDPPDEPRAVFANSLMDCYFALRTKSLLAQSKTKEEYPSHQTMIGSWDTPSGSAARAEVYFALSSSGTSGRTIRMPGLLRKIELSILDNPTHLGGYQLNLRNAPTLADVIVATRDRTTSNDLTGFESFITARSKTFQAIQRQQQQRQSDNDPNLCSGLVEVCDILELEPEILAYAEAYFHLSETVLGEADNRTRAARLELLAHLDTVDLRWNSNPSDPGKGLLVCPTHPLRLLWHLQHSRYRESTIDAISDRTKEALDNAELLQSLETTILPISLPLVIFDYRGRPFIEQDLLTPFWSLFLPADQEHQRSDISLVRMQVRNLLGIRRTATRLGEVQPSILARRIFEYLQRHPYVEQLRINVFNPGDGERIAQMLREVERLRQGLIKGTRQLDLRYAVHLLTSPEHLNLAGESLDALLDPERQVAEDDEFTVGSFNYLQPKLLISRSTHADFLRRPHEFTAHISILLEQFRVDGRLGESSRFARGLFIHGLVNETETQLEISDSAIYGWIRGVRAEVPHLQSSCDRLLVDNTRLMQKLQAAVAGSNNDTSTPVIALRLDNRDQGLLRAIHDVSDQVLTVDRNLGLDYFDSASNKTEIGYLLDFSPGFVRGDGERLLLTTRCTEELVALIRPVIRLAGIELPPDHEQFVLETLRSISGKLALRLFGSSNTQKEVTGLLFARLLLEQSDLLRDRIIIPVDAHQEWFTDSDETISNSRADLLVIDLNPITRTIDTTVVEVKLRSKLAVGDRTQLYVEMHEQAKNTVLRLRQQFDPDFLPRPRADLPLRSKELFSLLTFYINRALRYNLFSGEKARLVQPFIASLEEGYHLTFRTLGIVYSQETIGNHLDEDEPGFLVHRFGLDTAEILLNPFKMLSDTEDLTSQVDSSRADTTPSTPTIPSIIPDAAIDSLRSLFDAPKVIKSQLRVELDEASTIDETPEPVQRPPDNTEQEAPGEATSRASIVELKPPVYSVDSSTPPPVETLQVPKAIEPTVSTPTPIQPDILLGSTEVTPQFGLLGRFANARVAVDLTGCNTISLFGVQGFGKSYTLGVIAEMGAQAMSGINELTTPLATVLFHYHKSDAYEPEFLAATDPNNKTREIEKLLAEYQARPEGLRDLLLLVPEGKLEQRRKGRIQGLGEYLCTSPAEAKR
jgi:DNA phosphorothioation-dependent restriction protein DptH